MLARLREKSSNRTVLIFGGIKGFVRDGNDLKTQLEEAKPDLILISISQEQVKGLREFLKNPFEMNLSDYEVMYGVHLSLYGEVMTPPPIYVETLQYADRYNIEVKGLDMSEDEYQELYTGNMKTFDVVRHSVRKRRLLKKDFRASTPEGFVDAWTKNINRVKGLRKIDEARLEYIRNDLLKELEKTTSSNIFVVLEYEFYKDILDYLKNNGYYES